MISVLFLCTGNSCRSQMAEGWLKTLHPQLQGFSAGILAQGLNPLAVQVMAEAGVDISCQLSQTLDQMPTENIDYVFTVCDQAALSCPSFPARVQTQHIPFDDPPLLALNSSSEEEALQHYRRICNEIKEFVESIEQRLKPSQNIREGAAG